MAETMADKRKKQRASKVKGLHEGVGKFKGKKSLNLKDKQLGKKGRAAAKKRTVSISKTEHMKEGPNKGKVVGPKGNPLTGKVDMGGGNMAVYRDGKRVLAKTAKGTKTTNNKATAPKATSNQTKALTAAQKKAALSKGTSKSPTKGSGSSAGERKSTKSSGSSAGERKSIKGSGSSAGAKKSTAAKSTKTTSTGNGIKWNKPGGGGLVGPNSPIKGGRSKLKEGSTRMMVEGAGMNTKRVKYVVRNGKLVKA